MHVLTNLQVFLCKSLYNLLLQYNFCILKKSLANFSQSIMFWPYYIFIVFYKLFEWISCGNVSFSLCNNLSLTSIFVKSTCTTFSIDSLTFSSPSFPVSAAELSTAKVIVFCCLISRSYRSTEFLLFSLVLWVKENTEVKENTILENFCLLITCLKNKIFKCYRNEQEN